MRISDWSSDVCSSDLALDDLSYEFRQRGVEFADIIKLGRTQLQDAVPMTLGQEFEAFAINIKEDVARGDEIVKLFREINLGGTAVGTGINTEPEYSNLAIGELTRICGIEMVRASNLIEASSSEDRRVGKAGVSTGRISGRKDN